MELPDFPEVWRTHVIAVRRGHPDESMAGPEDTVATTETTDQRVEAPMWPH
jgi:hypothetical protein